MRIRLALALVSLVGGAAVAAAAGVHGTPAGRITYAAWIERGGGTGLLSSPLTLCEANGDGKLSARLSPRIGSFGQPAWTRDGSRIAFVSGSALRASPASPWNPRPLVASGRWPAWAPDAARIAYVGAGGLTVAAANGTAPRTVAGGQVSAPSWSGDGARIAFSRAGVVGSAGVFVVPAAGGAESKLNDDGQLPAWAPDGNRIAFVAATTPPATAGLLRQELYVTNPDGSGRVRLSDFAAEEASGPIDIRVDRPAWSPDSATIAVVRTVVFNGAKGSYVLKRNLFLYDTAAGGRVDASPAGAFGDPAWRPGPAFSPAAAAAKPCEIFGAGAKKLTGTAYDDLILGSDRAETILARAGNDWVHAERGADTIDGGPGRDEIWSGPGRDVDFARDGQPDVIHCGDEGRDTVHADTIDELGGLCRRLSR